MAARHFRVTMLPAAHGDGLWIEYGSGATSRRIVVDGGPREAYDEFRRSFDRLPPGDEEVELAVVTHVDLDHIEAPLRLLAHPRRQWPFVPRDIWFNGYRHMAVEPVLGALQGEFLGALLERDASAVWNKAFGGGPVVVPPVGPLPRIELEGGMVLTLLSPHPPALAAMARTWEKELKAFTPGDLKAALARLAADRRYAPDEGTLGVEDLDEALKRQLTGIDQSKANGTSIAFLAEFGKKSILFLADAHMKAVCASIRRLLAPGVPRLQVDAVKVAHHGSRHNMSPEFLELVEARHFLFSSDGGGKNHHPNEVVVQAIVTSMKSPTLWFNYRSAESTPWEARSKAPGATFATRYADTGAGITIDLCTRATSR
jgi:hypothetical protein